LHPGPDERDALTEEEKPELRWKALRGETCGRVRPLRESSPPPDISGREPDEIHDVQPYLPELADTVNLQALLDQLADFLLQSGFAGGAYSHPFWASSARKNPTARSTPCGRRSSRRSWTRAADARDAQAVAGESTGDAARDADLERQLGELLDKIVQKLMDEGYLNVTEAPKVPAGQQPLFGPGGMAKEAAQQVQFNLTEKGIDFSATEP